MNTSNDDSSENNWNDFSVKNNSSSNAHDLYNSYKIYKSRLKSLPKSELIRRGWISSKDDSTSLVNYFQDIHEQKLSTLYRKTDNADNSLVSLWLSQVKYSAELSVAINSTPSFQGLDKERLSEFAQMSVDENILLELPKFFARLGIVLVYLRSLPTMKLDGAVFKISSGNPVIGISFRYSRLDNFWFTLLHELAHVCLHMDLLNDPILDDLDLVSDSEIEVSANRLAKNSIVEKRLWRNCEPRYNKSQQAIERFSKKVGVHRNLIAGLLRREEGNYASYSTIINSINTRKVVFGND